MPWWSLLYLIAFVGFSMLALIDDYKERRGFWFISVAGLANIVIVYCFASYWNEGILDPISRLSPFLFIAAISWEAFQAVLDVRSSKREGDESDKEGLAAILAGVVLSIGFCLPVYIIAGMAAFRG